MKRFLTEPLLHFLLLGAAIFIVFEGMSDTGTDEQGEIIVTQARIGGLADKFSRTWQRPPNEAELNGLIQDYVREEAAVREAVALGIDRDDSVIRRLLRQRLEFVAEDATTQVEPTEAQLADYLAKYAEDFRSETSISFSHVFFNPQARGAALATDTAQLRARLNAVAGQEIEPTQLVELGDATLLDRQFTALPLSAVAQMFGEHFAEALRALAPGQWSTPISSAYGEHLVYVRERVPGLVPPLAEVREAVHREWINARRGAALDQYYAALLQRYRVTVEMPQSRPQSGDDQVAAWR